MAMMAGNAACFQRGSLFWFAVLTLSFGYCTWAVLWPHSIPYESLGLLGSFTQSLVDHHHTLLHNRQSYNSGRDRGKSSIHWLIPQMAAMTGAGPG
nr:transmembrane protein 254-like [Oryctolagus cuniculus]